MLLVLIRLSNAKLLGFLIFICLSLTWCHSSTERFDYIDNFEYISYTRIMLHPSSSVGRVGMHKRSLSSRIGQYDSFILEVYGYNTTFCIQLHPNTVLLHKEFLKSTKLTVYPYSGHVTAIKKDDDSQDNDYVCEWSHDENAANNMNNWARIVVHTDKKKTFKSIDFRPNRLKQFVNDWGSFTMEDVPFYEGTFIYEGDIYRVKTIEAHEHSRNYKDRKTDARNNRHIHHYHADLMMYRVSDVKTVIGNEESPMKPDDYSFCGIEHAEWNVNEAESHYQSILKQFGRRSTLGENQLYKRSVDAGCPTAKKILYSSAAVDCTYVQMAGGSENSLTRVISAWNEVSAIYETTFNIYIGLFSVNVMTSCETSTTAATKWNVECSDSYDISTRLSDFSYWRGTTQNSTAGLWHLMSNCSSGATVGIAWLNMVCTTDQFSQTASDGTTQYISGCAVTTWSNTEFMTVSHEMGHNFGAIHDCTSATCSACGYSDTNCANCCPCTGCDCENSYIMNPTSNVPSENPKFSPCSQTTICSKNQQLATCLEEPGDLPVFNTFICGNGIQEGTEECDCGSECATNNCCFQNCTLKAGAVCSDSNDGCCHDCQIIPASQDYVCRPANGVCDVPEVCLGQAACPPDLFKQNGIACGNTSSDGLKCASGVCTSRTLQCEAFRADTIADCAAYYGQCALFCDTSEDGCIKISGYYLDGTPCGSNGFCSNKICSNPDLIGKITQWILGNQTIAIVIVVIVAIIFLILANKCLKNVKAEKDSALLQRARLEENEIKRMQEVDRKQRDKQRNTRRQQQQQIDKSAVIGQDRRKSAASSQQNKRASVAASIEMGKSAVKTSASYIENDKPIEPAKKPSRSRSSSQTNASSSSKRQSASLSKATGKNHSNEAHASKVASSFDPRSPIAINEDVEEEDGLF